MGLLDASDFEGFNGIMEIPDFSTMLSSFSDYLCIAKSASFHTSSLFSISVLYLHFNFCRKMTLPALILQLTQYSNHSD